MGPLQVTRDEVHAWCVALDVPAETVSRLSAILPADARDRSARFHFERDRRRFVVAHGALQDLLAAYLEVDPACIRFVYNAFGKPALGPEFGSRIKFNLSHSAGYALIGVTAGAEIGVDLERIREGAQPEHAEIARRFFTPAEVDELSRLPDHLQAPAFFRYWTRTEAYVKARGEGLVESRSNDVAADGRWSVYTVHPAPGYIGALVVEGGGHICGPRRVPLPSPSSRLQWPARPLSFSSC